MNKKENHSSQLIKISSNRLLLYSGLAFGGLTLLFLMWIIYTGKYTSGNCHGIALLIGLGCALCFGLIGTDALAQGEIPLSGDLKPFQFSVGGGIAVFAITFTLTVFFCPVPTSSKKSVKELKRREMISTTIPDNIKIRETVYSILSTKRYGVKYRNCPDSLLDLRLSGGLIQTKGSEAMKSFIQRLPSRTKGRPASFTFDVLYQSNEQVFYVQCEM